MPRRGYPSTLGPAHLKAGLDMSAWEHLCIWELASGYASEEMGQMRQEAREAPGGACQGGNYCCGQLSFILLGSI